MPKPLALFAQLHTFTPTARAFSESSSFSSIRSSSVCPVALTWAPPAHTFSSYRRLLLFVPQGKTTHGFSAAAGLAVIPDARWALCFCLERDAEEGHCAPLEGGGFAMVFKQDSGIRTDHVFCCFALTIFLSLCFNQTADALAHCRTARFRPIFCNTIKDSKTHLPHTKLFKTINQKGYFIY